MRVGGVILVWGIVHRLRGWIWWWWWKRKKDRESEGTFTKLVHVVAFLYQTKYLTSYSYNRMPNRCTIISGIVWLSIISICIEVFGLYILCLVIGWFIHTLHYCIAWCVDDDDDAYIWFTLHHHKQPLLFLWIVHAIYVCLW